MKRNLLTVVIMEGLEDPIFRAHERLVKGRHFYVNILIMFKPVKDFMEILKLLRYLYERKFVNSDLYYVNSSNAQNEVFGFASFPVFRVENKTHLVGNVREFYRRIIDKTDLLGYRFETPLMMDPPKVIRYQNKDNQVRFQGVTFNIMKMSLEYLNGTLTETKPEHGITGIVDMKYVLEEVRQNNVELAAHAYALFHNDDLVQKSYPLLVVNWCLMVPVDNKVTTFLYPVLPFEWPVWITIFIVFVLVNSITYLVQKLHHLDRQNYILINFCKFMNVPPPVPSQVGNEHWLEVLLNGAIFIHSFFLMAFYTSMLGSFLTVTIIQPRINNIDDLVRAHLPVMIIDYELEFLLEQGIHLPLKFLHLLRPVNSTIFYLHQFSLNSSYGYFTTYDTWHFLNIQQQNLKPPLFRYSDICFGDYHLAFPMVTESPIWRDLEYLMFRIHSSGLYYYHEKKSYEYALRAGWIKHRTRMSSFQTVGLSHLRMVVGFLIAGLVLAFLSFLNELRTFRKHKKK